MARYMRPGYLQIIGLQIVIALIATGGFGLLRGANSALSALAGGLVCAVPSALFALRLWLAERRGGSFGVAFAVGELLKVVLTGVLLFLVFKWYPGVDGLALVVGFIATLHGYLFSLLISR